MSDQETVPLGGFGFAIRTFWISGKALVASRRWEREATIDPDAGAKFSISVTGKAVTKRDSVCVIGKDRETKEFDLSIYSDEVAEQEWEWTKAHDIFRSNENTPEFKVKQRAREILDEAPPTATLIFTEDDLEVGFTGGWSIDCAVPPSVLAQLETDILAHRVSDLHIGIKWAAGLVKNARTPPDFPTSWGLVEVDKRLSPEPLQGHTVVIKWNSHP